MGFNQVEYSLITLVKNACEQRFVDNIRTQLVENKATDGRKQY